MGTSIAVLHLRYKDPRKVYNLAGRVCTNMLDAASVFPNPDPSMKVFVDETAKLGDVLNAKDGSKIKNQAIVDQTDVVFRMLKSLANYVNKVAGGDKGIIFLSGFDCNNERVAHSIPGRALIRRIDDGSVFCSAKIYLDRLYHANRFKVEITTTPDNAETWKIVLDFGGIDKLEVRDLAYGEKIYIRVSGGNTHGWGTPSEPIVFIPR
jgi:hypothetical protein